MVSEWMQGFIVGSTIMWMLGNIAMILYWVLADIIKQHTINGDPNERDRRR